MKYIIVFIAGCLISTINFAQLKYVMEQRVVAPAGTVSMREIHPSPYTYIPVVKKAANLDKLKAEQRRLKSGPDQGGLVIPTTTVMPISRDQGTVQAPNIFESPCVSYLGMNGGGFIPPDVSGTVGFDHIFMTLNDSFRIQDKNGTVLYQQRQMDPAGFWSPVGVVGLFDPKIIYDPYRQRWVHVIVAESNSANSAILIAASQTADPMGNWSVWRIDADGDNDQWFDYPSVGFNRNWVVISGNMFSNPGMSGANECRVFIFNINDLYAGGNLGFGVTNTNAYSTICPALTYDPNMNDLWCVTNDDIDDNDLRYFRVGGGPGTPSFTEEGWVSIGSDWGRGGNDIGPQSGSATPINTNDHDVLSVVWRNGRLYSVQTIFLPDEQNPPTSCTIQMVSADPGSTTVHEAIRFASSATSMYAHPCIVVNNNNDVIIGCTRLTSGIFPSACVLVRRSGSGTFFESTYKLGEDWYVNTDNIGRNRWGDYTTAMIDPSDDNSVWVAAEYSRPRVIPGNAGQYGTWWAKICSGVCFPDVFVNTIQTNGTSRKFEASNNVYASSQINSGANIKLDAGIRIVLQPGFRANAGSRVRTYIEGCGGVQ